MFRSLEATNFTRPNFKGTVFRFGKIFYVTSKSQSLRVHYIFDENGAYSFDLQSLPPSTETMHQSYPVTIQGVADRLPGRLYLYRIRNNTKLLAYGDATFGDDRVPVVVKATAMPIEIARRILLNELGTRVAATYSEFYGRAGGPIGEAFDPRSYASATCPDVPGLPDLVAKRAVNTWKNISSKIGRLESPINAVK